MSLSPSTSSIEYKMSKLKLVLYFDLLSPFAYEAFYIIRVNDALSAFIRS